MIKSQTAGIINRGDWILEFLEWKQETQKLSSGWNRFLRLVYDPSNAGIYQRLVAQTQVKVY